MDDVRAVMDAAGSRAGRPVRMLGGRCHEVSSSRPHTLSARRPSSPFLGIYAKHIWSPGLPVGADPRGAHPGRTSESRARTWGQVRGHELTTPLSMSTVDEA